MDVCEPEKVLGKQSSAVNLRPPLVSADNKNGATRRSKTREVSSRYMSPTRSVATAAAPKRSVSPNAIRASSTSAVQLPKRAVSAERRRPSTPSSPRSPSPSTPVHDTGAAVQLTPRKGSSNKSAESLWPSTMRSLNVSFQSDAFGAKKEKAVPRTPPDRTLKPPSNVARKVETPTTRKPTPEKRRSPLKGKNSADQLENSKPADSLPPRLLDQHRWPSRNSGRIPSEKVNQTPLSNHRMVTPSSRRLSLDGTSRNVRKTASDLLKATSQVESEKEMHCGSALHEKVQRPSSSSSSSCDKTPSMSGVARTQSLPLPLPRSRPSSPSVSRGVSPSRGRILNPSSRGTSPSRVRPSSPSRQPQDTSVLSFIADIKKGKKAANDIEDVHQLRMLYNRHLQWRFANSRTHDAMCSQKAKAEVRIYVLLNLSLVIHSIINLLPLS